MSKKKKKVVVTGSNTLKPTRSTVKERKSPRQAEPSGTPLVFGKENYKWMGIGLVLVAVGMLLMIGGYNEDPNVWDESAIYGFRRTLLAPVVILAGLAVEVYAIFK